MRRRDDSLVCCGRHRVCPGRECGMGSLFSIKMERLNIFLRLQVWMGVGKVMIEEKTLAK